LITLLTRDTTRQQARLYRTMTTTARERTLPTKFYRGCIKSLDQRTELAKRLNQAFQNIVLDLGGFDALSHTRLALIERFVFLEHTLQKIECRIGKRPKQSEELLGRWIQGLNSLQGLAKTIGLQRKQKTLDVKSYVAGKERDK
jgi:hypothetical protein